MIRYDELTPRQKIIVNKIEHLTNSSHYITNADVNKALIFLIQKNNPKNKSIIK